MSRPHAQKLALCATVVVALAAPTIAAGDPGTGGSQAPPPPQTEGVISAKGPQIEVATRAGAMLRKLARFRGSVAAAAAGRTVTIERFDDATQAWTKIAGTTVASDGTYLARWRTKSPGVFRVRAVLQSGSQAIAASASPELAISVHRPAMATWYGPGFYGRKTACGVRMSRTLLGVAHKKYPCGTQVAESFVKSTGGLYLNGGDTSAYVVDWAIGQQYRNYAFRMSAAPEPASWAMMLGGFGLVGGAMRRRKASVAFA